MMKTLVVFVSKCICKIARIILCVILDRIIEIIYVSKFLFLNAYKSLFQAVHVAAQYGQTAFLNHIVVKYHADFDVPDNEGRSPLHW